MEFIYHQQKRTIFICREGIILPQLIDKTTPITARNTY
jgi:hypothetical protein